MVNFLSNTAKKLLLFGIRKSILEMLLLIKRINKTIVLIDNAIKSLESIPSAIADADYPSDFSAEKDLLERLYKKLNTKYEDYYL